MKYAIIENGVVANLVVADGALPGLQMVPAENAHIGDLWDGQYFTAPPPLPPTRDELKAQRDAAVAAIVVTTTAGNTFDGDETSQDRMSRAVVALSNSNPGAAPPGPTVNWVLADNTVIQATKDELAEALILAGGAQAAIWVI